MKEAMVMLYEGNWAWDDLPWSGAIPSPSKRRRRKKYFDGYPAGSKRADYDW